MEIRERPNCRRVIIKNNLSPHMINNCWDRITAIDKDGHETFLSEGMKRQKFGLVLSFKGENEKMTAVCKICKQTITTMLVGDDREKLSTEIGMMMLEHCNKFHRNYMLQLVDLTRRFSGFIVMNRFTIADQDMEDEKEGMRDELIERVMQDAPVDEFEDEDEDDENDDEDDYKDEKYIGDIDEPKEHGEKKIEETEEEKEIREKITRETDESRTKGLPVLNPLKRRKAQSEPDEKKSITAP